VANEANNNCYPREAIGDGDLQRSYFIKHVFFQLTAAAAAQLLIAFTRQTVPCWNAKDHENNCRYVMTLLWYFSHVFWMTWPGWPGFHAYCEWH